MHSGYVMNCFKSIKFSRRLYCSLKAAQKIGEYDVAIVGGGIIGTSTARELLLAYPKLRVVLLEKEKELGLHQTANNSGVIHAGIYYKPGSLKAKLCVQGSKLTMDHCDKKKIPYKKVGKLIVATDEEEVKYLKVLYERGLSNGVQGLEFIDTQEKIHEREPECRGLKAIWSPNTAIVDYKHLAKSHADDFHDGGGEIRLRAKVAKIEESGRSDFPVRVVDSKDHTLVAKYVLTCAGLYSDKISMLTGCPRNPRIVPFRGEYLLLKPSKRKMVKCNIYPVPNPKLPFLGVHFTPRMDGNVWLGPNAVLAFQREGYSYFDINPLELIDALTYSGFITLCLKNLRYGMGEMLRSIIWPLQVKQLQKYLPSITSEDCERGPAGVRAQALAPDGSLLEDFYFDKSKMGNLKDRVLHCRNCPSPGATSSMAIAKMLVEKMGKEFGLEKIHEEIKTKLKQ
ncbi:L-2-hydroxyglutarate dehydrogenase, mitochondrial [Coccinella septempunctata]|uniref:L-2-hydroxyglutarate dehydrogenase, mitochondrial n=1 Tax=Coccinella septempunctata TaxID=41139 RepID=UPI001D08B66B|nr:L-2-hydroxyglutarate dehydrogenase, mitochondrial [Coccinella septempunctata]